MCVVSTQCWHESFIPTQKKNAAEAWSFGLAAQEIAEIAAGTRVCDREKGRRQVEVFSGDG